MERKKFLHLHIWTIRPYQHRFTGEPQWIAKTAVLGPSVMLTQLCHVAVGQDIRTIMETQLGLF